jgi:hypothetical protein
MLTGEVDSFEWNEPYTLVGDLFAITEGDLADSGWGNLCGGTKFKVDMGLQVVEC